jgi:hypothetical protein
LTNGAYDDLALLLVILVVAYLLIRAENNAPTPSAASGCSGQVLENHQQLHKLVLTTGCTEAG